MTKVSLHRFAGVPRRFLWALGLGLGILTVGAIAPPPAPRDQGAAPATPTPTQAVQAHFTPLSPAVAAPDRLWVASQTQLPGVLTVTLYTPTANCDRYETVAKAIAADKAIPQIVHFLLTDQTPHLLGFELAGYRVQPSDQGDRVTVDLRRAPHAQRPFMALSICEQLALFGSVRQTLLNNPALGINDVQFTERGQAIAL